MPTYYLNADTGSNSNDGSSGSPWLTITYAHGQASDSDTVILQESTATYDYPSMTFSKNITWEGENQMDVTKQTIDGGGLGKRLGFTNSQEWKNLIFQDAFDNAPFFLTGGTLPTVLMENCRFLEIDLNTSSEGQMFLQNTVGGKIQLKRCLVIDPQRSSGSGTMQLIKGGGGSRNFEIESCIFALMTASVNIDKVFGGSFGTLTAKNSAFYNGTGTTIPFGYSGSGFTKVYGNDFSSGPSELIATAQDYIDAANNNFNLQPDSAMRNDGIFL